MPDLRRSSPAGLTTPPVPSMAPDDRSIGDALAADGRVLLLRTRGRVTGGSATAAVGYVDEPDGSLLVAAGSDEADWARNVAADPEITATWAGRSRRFRAERLEDAAFAAAITALILRYGTPAERLGRGPAFRLVPLDAAAPADPEGPASAPATLDDHRGPG